MKPVVALVGRPNVGKSTLFNRLTRTKDALVDDFPGVTRDRNYGNVKWEDKEFTLVDTGGFADGDMDVFAPQIREQIDQAVGDSDAVILLMDGRDGLSPFESDMIAMFRALKKPVFYAANKIDGPEQEKNLYEFYELGLDRLYPLSSAHGYGVHDLLDDLMACFPEIEVPLDETGEQAIKVAVVGRPNVGKSSLVNRIIGENRLLVSNIPGTTRDAVDTMFEIDGQSYLFIDTAGIRRKGKVSKKIEKFSVIKALKSLDRCDVALILIDSEEGVTEQDITVAGYAYDRGRGCILILNKWDLVEKDAHTSKNTGKASGIQPSF
jgi:GTP-binding protein